VSENFTLIFAETFITCWQERHLAKIASVLHKQLASQLLTKWW